MINLISHRPQNWDTTTTRGQQLVAVAGRRLRWLVAALPLFWVATAVHADSDFIVTIHSDSGLCLDVNRHSTEKNANLIVYRCHGEDNQRFALKSSGRDEEWFTAESVHSGLCLDIKGNSKSGSAQLIQYPCQGSSNQSFDFRSKSRNSRTGEIRVKRSNMCLDAGDGRNHTRVVQHTCDGSDKQQWTISRS